MSDKAEPHGVSRRRLLQGATLAAASGWTSQAARAQGAGQVAVIFLSRSGNTRVLAGALSRRFGSDLTEIRPRDTWPEDYDEMVDWASRWRESDRLLPLESAPALSDRSTIFLGFPIWGGSLPAPMRSFLSTADLAGKTVLPFITHGGYGAGSSMMELRSLAPDTSFTEPFVLECDQERDNLASLGEWLNGAANIMPR
ncbi:MAG: flavodoxin [Pikeienuella sp.]